MPLHYIPKGYPAVCPYLFVKDMLLMSDFLQKVFGAKETERITDPSGVIRHLEVTIEGSVIMMGSATEEWPAIPGSNYIYCKNVDEAYQKALDNGANSLSPPADQFYGDRSAGVKDSQGNFWWIATHIQDVSEEDMNQKAQK